MINYLNKDINQCKREESCLDNSCVLRAIEAVFPAQAVFHVSLLGLGDKGSLNEILVEKW